MWKQLLFVLVMMGVLMPRLSDGQEAKAVLDGVAKAMGDRENAAVYGEWLHLCGWPEPLSRDAVAALQRQKLHPFDQLRHRCRCGTRLSGRRLNARPRWWRATGAGRAAPEPSW